MHPLRISIVTYNIWLTQRWTLRAPALRGFLESFNPDILCLQELQQTSRDFIDATLPAHKRVDEAQLLTGLTALLAEGKVADAARYYGQCRGDMGYPLMAALAGRKELEERLAQMLYTAKDFHKAAQVLDSLGRHDKAAILFERSDDSDFPVVHLDRSEIELNDEDFLEACRLHGIQPS